MHSVESIASGIVGREGGFVNDPDDPGGATKFGVTIHTMRALRADNDGDGQVTVADVKALTREQAVEIYVTHYFRKPQINLLPREIQASVFDMQVNAGSNAVKILQRLLGAFGQSVKADGAIGPVTAAAAETAMALAPDHLVDAYGIARRNYYYRLADLRPASRKYAKRQDGGKGGWITRAEEFISERFHFTATQHNRRVSAWA